MSYILEALRRAESERERKRGGVPGLHARPVPMPSSDELGERRGKAWPWLTGAVSVGLLLMILWRWWSVEPLVDETMLARAPVGGNVSQGGADAASAPPAPPAPVPAPAQPAPQAAPAPSPAPAPKAAASGAAPDKAPRSSKPATPPRSTATAAASPRQPPAQGSAPAAPTPQAALPAPAPAPERLRTLAELPDDVRRSVPQLAFGGSVYSDTPAQRMVIFNGQVMREGDAVTDDLQVEQIRPRSAVMRVRGQRFEMPF